MAKDNSIEVTIRLDSSIVDKILDQTLESTATSGVEKFILSAIEYKLTHLIKSQGLEINQYSSDGVILETFDSLRQAANSTGESYWGIRDCIRGKQKHTSGGYSWKLAPKRRSEVSR